MFTNWKISMKMFIVDKIFLYLALPSSRTTSKIQQISSRHIQSFDAAIQHYHLQNLSLRTCIWITKKKILGEILKF